MNKMLTAIAFMIAGIMLFSGCAANASNTDASDATISTTSQTTKEPIETAVVTKPTQKADVTSSTTAKETTAATTTATETTAPAATTKTTTAPTATTKSTTAPAATTKATITATTAVATTAAPKYAENCDNIKSLIIAQLQSKGLWFPDVEVNGGGSVQLSVGYANADDQYATAFVNGKFGTPDGTGATSVSVWIADGYLNMSYKKCTLPAA